MGRVFAMVFAVLASGVGAGILAWGIAAAAVGEHIRTPCGIRCCIGTASEVIGWGAGLLAVGLSALVLSLAAAKKNQGSE